MKIAAEAVGAMLTGRGRCFYGTASFTLAGETFEYLKPDPGHQPEDAKSWTYGNYPKVLATLPLADGGTVTVNVRRITDSEWDIEEYRRCPEHLRGILWGHRLPGFLPA